MCANDEALLCLDSKLVLVSAIRTVYSYLLSDMDGQNAQSVCPKDSLSHELHGRDISGEWSFRPAIEGGSLSHR